MLALTNETSKSIKTAQITSTKADLKSPGQGLFLYLVVVEWIELKKSPSRWYHI